MPIENYAETGAIFSTGRRRRHRYVLWRVWARDLPSLAFIGLNPSTADATKDDPTIRRMLGFARRWRYGSLFVVNLFSLRETNSAKLQSRTLKTLTTAENDFWLAAVARCCDKVVVGWGNKGALHERSTAQCLYETPLWCLGKTKSGAPFHPLYRPSATKLRQFAPTKAAVKKTREIS